MLPRPQPKSQTSGGKSSTVKADVSSDKQVRSMVGQVIEKWGRLDILVNNAGFTRFIDHANLEAMEEEIWDNIFAVNLKGVFFCCRAVAPVMKKQGSGRVINIASVAGITGNGSSIAYCASKAGVISVTKSLARVLAPEATCERHRTRTDRYALAGRRGARRCHAPEFSERGTIEARGNP